jgi:hypothetical protein
MRQGVVGTVLVAFAIAGCGGGDDAGTTTPPSQPDGASLTAPFDALAEQAYKDAGKDRQQDYTAGVQTDGCFAADDEAARAIGDATGLDVAFAKENYLQGLPDQQEHLICSIEPGPGEDHPVIVNVAVGTTTFTPDQMLDNLKRLEKDTHELSGSAEGLDPATVLAVESGGINQFFWIDGDFTVSLGGLSEKLSPDQGFAALSAAVQGVSRTLGQ